MSVTTPALYCDGAWLASEPVMVELPGDGLLHLSGEGFAQTVPLADIRISARLARVPRFLSLPNGATVEIFGGPDIDAQLDAARPPTRLATLLHTLEAHSTAAAIATLLLVVAIGSVWWFGLPMVAHRLAFAVPTELEARVGKTAFAVLDRNMGNSGLSAGELFKARLPFERLIRANRNSMGDRTLVFRPMNVANAFALPGGVIVVGDKLVRLALTRPNGADLLAAVYAHELTHVARRHGLQLLLRSSGALVVVATLTGDLSTLTALSGTLPFLLIQRGYAREFEREADTGAVELLRTINIKPSALADMLELLEKERPKTGPDFSYLNTHPSTSERIRLLREGE